MRTYTDEQREKARLRAAKWYAANKDRAKAYRIANSDRIKQIKAEYCAENKESIKNYKAAYRSSKMEDIREQRRKWRARNYESIRKYQAEYRAANNVRIKASRAAYYANNREHEHANSRIGNQNRRAKKRASGGRLSRGIVRKFLFSQNGQCVYCKAHLTKSGYHLDHIVPLALGGPHADKNVQLLCPSCNLSKGAKHPDEFARSFGVAA